MQQPTTYRLDAYVNSNLFRERIVADECGCVYAWRAGSSEHRPLIKCGDGANLSPVLHSIILATYGNPVEDCILWQ